MMIGTSIRGAQLAADLDAVAARQHQVEHDAVVLAAQRFGLAFDAIPRRGDEHAVSLQVARGQLGEARVVLDEKDFDGGQGFGHRDTINTSEAPGGNLHSLQRHSLK